ncbi:Signal transduction histidine kinase [Nonomuraea solani]|uniref:Signal transduction histidine kinase n=1 Tax=Nonomuraea solani TaxID=1144553 RepID=A0A1H5UWJ9_9ACTN|nr:histidine kinase [Nonomuraea solani]SEF79393.1 Signal transduction histidine kinase [Nonomuraea solani]
MRRIEPDAWAGLTALLMCVAVGTPTLFSGAVTLTWAVLFAGLVTALTITALCEDNRLRVARAAYGAGVLLGWATVLTAPKAGWLSILLVFIAAMSAYVLPRWAGPVVIALNSGVIALTASRAGAPGAEVTLSALLYLLIQAATWLSTIAIIREQRMRRELAEAHVELRAASVVLAETTRAHERLRISRELHDLIGHQLTALTLELEVARHQEGPAAREHVERANRVARDLLGDVRQTVGQLRADAPDLRESLAAVVRDIPGLDIGVCVDDDVQAGEELTVTLIRVVQEIVTNTIRHAAATSLRIRIESEPDHTVRLTSVDDGRGSPEVRPGNGLRGLAERVGAIGGDVRLDGSDGFRVTARMPAR